MTSLWTLDEGNPEPDETFQFHLSHPANVPIGRATATATILNDDTQVISVGPNVVGDDGTTTFTLRGTGLTSQSTALFKHGGRPDVAALSYVPSDDGLSATAVFDTTGLTPLDTQWYVEARTFGAAGGYQFVTLQHAASAAQPYIQATGAPIIRGGIPTYAYVYFGNLGASASQPAFLHLSGYPVASDIVVDHVPPGGHATVYDGLKGRTIVVSVGRIAAKTKDFVRIRYTPTTTIAGHTELRLQPSLTFGDAIAPATDLRTLNTFSALPTSAGELFASSMAFSPAGSLAPALQRGAVATAPRCHPHRHDAGPSGPRWPRPPRRARRRRRWPPAAATPPRVW